MAAKLKVFVTGNGFTDYVVATSSRPKALAAWGVSQDLFKEGVARETDDPDLIKAALAEPGKVLERKGGSRDALTKVAPASKPKASGPSKAALKRVADLEERLSSLEADFDERLAQVAADREALDRREAKLTAERQAARDDLNGRLRRARAG
ncbi:MAG: hypothetical protein JWP35_2078 [Caulobacter sp.]|nr:hypothetical protein [Caulobacter sp.]